MLLPRVQAKGGSGGDDSAAISVTSVRRNANDAKRINAGNMIKSLESRTVLEIELYSKGLEDR